MTKTIWNFDRCQEEALLFNTKKDFMEKSKTCYNVACSKGFLEKICSHMMPLIKPSGFGKIKIIVILRR